MAMATTTIAGSTFPQQRIKDKMLRAFTRTRALRGPGRADVDLAMSKWWTKKRPAEGQVSEGCTWVVPDVVLLVT